MKFWWKRSQPLAILFAVAVLFGACDEQLDSGGACPSLCPIPQAAVRDTSFFAVAFDTSVAGFPSLGLESVMFIVSFGDTLQSAGIVRYDNLPKTYRRINSAVDSNIVAIDTGSVIRLHITTPDTLGVATTVEAYDVDLGGAEETDPTAIGSAFTPDRFLGSHTFPPESLRDSIDVPIDPTKLLTKIQADSPFNRLRVGLRVKSPTSGSTKLSVATSNGDPLNPARLIFRPTAGDTTVALVVLEPNSLTPSDPTLADALKDYLAVILAPPPPPADAFRVGGLPASRGYLRFDIPARLLDSTDIIRATLVLTQRPSPTSAQPADTVGIQQFAVTAGSAVTDLRRALQLLLSARADTTRFVPLDSGSRSFEMIEQVRFWRSTKADQTPRALALSALREGFQAGQIDFFSLEAPAAVRPVLRITYLPRREAGFP